jgi:hypothetical protein
MKVSMVTAVGLLVVTFACWLTRAEAQHGARKAAPPPPRPKPQPKPHVAAPKPAAKHPQPKAAPKAKHEAKKDPAQAKEKKAAKAEGKKAEGKKAEAKKQDAKKDPAQVKEKKASKAEAKKHEEKKKEARKEAEKKAGKAGAGRDPESVSLLHAAHQALHRADGDYDGLRVRSMDHIGAALGHLGSSAPAGVGGGHLPQGMSDNILREARMRLEMARARLAASPAHAHARGAVEGAIREIDLALSVR